MQAQGLAYSKRVTKTKYQGSLQDFLLATDKQMYIKSEPPKPIIKSKALHKRSENVGSLGSKHAELLLRLLKSCSEEMVKMVVTSMTEDQLDILSQLMESCPLDMTTKVVEKLMEMDREQFDLITQVVKSSTTKEKLANLVEDLIGGGVVIKPENSFEEGDESKVDEHNNEHDDIESKPKIFTYPSPKDLDKEIKKKKRKCKRNTQEEKGYACTICGRKLNRSADTEVQRHLATHTADRDFKCDECGSEFSRVQELSRHKKIHTGYCPFRCNFCKAGFKAKMALRAHNSSIHNSQTTVVFESDVWSFDCKQCDTKFLTSTAFGKHMKLLHGVGKPFICNKCGIGMSTPDNLKRHSLVAHTDVKPFNCEECGTMFGTKSQLMNHQLKHAKNN